MQQRSVSANEHREVSTQGFEQKRIDSLEFYKDKKSTGAIYRNTEDGNLLHISGVDRDGFYVPPSRQLAKHQNSAVSKKILNPIAKPSEQVIVEYLKLKPNKDGKYSGNGVSNLSAREHWAIHWLDLKPIAGQAKTFKRPGFTGTYQIAHENGEISVYYSGGQARSRDNTVVKMPPQSYFRGVWDLTKTRSSSSFSSTSTKTPYSSVSVTRSDSFPRLRIEPRKASTLPRNDVKSPSVAPKQREQKVELPKKPNSERIPTQPAPPLELLPSESNKKAPSQNRTKPAVPSLEIVPKKQDEEKSPLKTPETKAPPLELIPLSLNGSKFLQTQGLGSEYRGYENAHYLISYLQWLSKEEKRKSTNLA